MTIEQRLNWQISEMRGWRKIDAGNGCTSLVAPGGHIIVTSRHPERIQENEINWHSDTWWPTLFVEFPKGTMLFQPDHPGATAAWALCGCQCKGLVRVCQPGATPAEVTCRAWIAMTIGASLAAQLPTGLSTVSPSMSPESSTVH